MATLDELLALLPDNDTGEIDAVDLRTIVTELWNQGADIAARVSALEASSGGGDGTITANGRWQYNSQSGAVPGGMQVTADSGELALATWLRFAKFDQNNNDMTLALMGATTVFAQQQADSGSWARYTVNGSPTDGGSYVQVPVQYVTGDGSSATVEWQHAIFVFTVEPPTP